MTRVVKGETRKSVEPKSEQRRGIKGIRRMFVDCSVHMEAFELLSTRLSGARTSKDSTDRLAYAFLRDFEARFDVQHWEKVVYSIKLDFKITA